MAQQTAVDWLEKELKNRYPLINSEPLFEQAKQMEEDINRKSFEAGNKRGWSGYPNTDNWTQPTFEQYYNETYGTRLQNETKSTPNPIPPPPPPPPIRFLKEGKEPPKRNLQQ